MEIICDICRKEIVKPGALMFSPPDKNGFCQKFHICTECFDRWLEKEVKKASKQKEQ